MNQTVSSRDELDALLGAFYKAQLPTPWPAFKAPARTQMLPLRPDRGRRWSVIASRVALAASVALLLLGFWLLPAISHKTDGPAPLPTIGPAGAGRGSVLDPGGVAPGTQPGTLTPDKGKVPTLNPDKISIEELVPKK